jgi:hypothetical protein
MLAVLVPDLDSLIVSKFRKEFSLVFCDQGIAQFGQIAIHNEISLYKVRLMR